MQNDVIMAGFGGQGILLIGKMLAYTGMMKDWKFPGCRRTALK